MLLGSCNSNDPLYFNEQEKELINSGDENQAMRVLLTTDYNDSIFLRQKSKDIKPNLKDSNLLKLIKRMRVSLSENHGVGIAAPQVGVARNIFLLCRLDKPGSPVEAIINPQIISYSSDTTNFYGDGCLSIPDMWGVSERYKSLRVKYYNEQGLEIEEEINGYLPNDFTAIIFQHEFDHLQGTLFIDRIHNNELYISSQTPRKR